MAGSRIWKRRFANLLGCCLPSPSPHTHNDEVQQKLLQPPTSDFCSRSDDIDVQIQQHKAPIFLTHGDDQEELLQTASPSKSEDDPFKNLSLLGKEKRRPKTVLVDPRSRAHCIDCLIDAAEKLHCAPSTLHLAVNYLDRYLSTSQFDYLSGNDLEIEDLRFVGLTCLMIASKYDGVQNQFQFDAYLGLCKSSVSRADLIRMESCILSCLGFEMAAVTAWSFLEQLVAQGGKEVSSECMCMASYFAEVSLLSEWMLPFLPSVVAASSVFLAQYVLEPSKKPWSGARRSDLRDCVLALRDCCYGSDSYYLPAITMKYSKSKYKYVALKNSPTSIPLHFFQD